MPPPVNAIETSAFNLHIRCRPFSQVRVISLFLTWESVSTCLPGNVNNVLCTNKFNINTFVYPSCARRNQCFCSADTRSTEFSRNENDASWWYLPMYGVVRVYGPNSPLFSARQIYMYD